MIVDVPGTLVCPTGTDDPSGGRIRNLSNKGVAADCDEKLPAAFQRLGPERREGQGTLREGAIRASPGTGGEHGKESSRPTEGTGPLITTDCYDSSSFEEGFPSSFGDLAGSIQTATSKNL